MPQADSRSTIPIQPLPKALPPATRKIVNAAIKQHMAATEALIAFLDKADGDPDEEPCITSEPHDEDPDREPSLAHTLDLDQERARRHLGKPGTPDFYGPDLEAEHDGREPEDETDGLHDGELDDADQEPRCPPMMD